MPYKNALLLMTLFAITMQKVNSQILIESRNENSGVMTTTTTTTTGGAYDYDYGCSEGAFDCGSGECISEEHVCDTFVDCNDGRDEINCTNVTKACGKDEFDCGDHFCIAKEKVCDGFLNCHNSLDERDCVPTNQGAQTTTATKTEETTTETTEEYEYEYEADCFDYEYACKDALCINKTQLCDGTHHCVSGEDELDCLDPSPSETTESSRTSTISTPTCRNNQFQCLNEKCVESSKLCDGKDDCGDNSDEKNCQATTTSIIITKVLNATRTTVLSSSRCIYNGVWYPSGSEIVPGKCSVITCTSSGRVRKSEDPTCAGCISAKTNRILLLLLAAICMLANLR